MRTIQKLVLGLVLAYSLTLTSCSQGPVVTSTQLAQPIVACAYCVVPGTKPDGMGWTVSGTLAGAPAGSQVLLYTTRVSNGLNCNPVLRLLPGGLPPTLLTPYPGDNIIVVPIFMDAGGNLMPMAVAPAGPGNYTCSAGGVMGTVSIY